MATGRPHTLTRPWNPAIVTALVDGTGVHGQPEPAEVWEAVRRLALLGYSDGQIGAAVGRGRRQVQRIREEYGIPAPCRGLNGMLRPVHGVPCLPREAH